MIHDTPLFNGPAVDNPWPLNVAPSAKPRARAWTWQQLIAIEPGLRELELDVTMASTLNIDRLWSWHKRRLGQLAGWHARRRELASSEAYDTAFRHLRGVFECYYPED